MFSKSSTASGDTSYRSISGFLHKLSATCRAKPRSRILRGYTFSLVKLLQASIDLLPDTVQSPLFRCLLNLQQAQGLANDFRGGRIAPAAHPLVHPMFQFWRKRYVHGT